jgi:F-type H+-transporting ATPase subunit delta
MSVLKIATRYAKSLIELAVEQGKLESVHNDIQLIRTVTANREFYLMLKSPVIQNDKKTAAVNAIFSGKVDTLTLTYMQLLIQKNREAFLPEIAAAFGQQYKELKQITTVKIISAVELSAPVMDEIQRKLLETGLTKGTLEILTQTDPTLIGGFVLEFDNKRYDASLNHQLDQLKKQFSKNLYVKLF